MRSWRLWSYSLSLAVLVTAVAHSFYRQGGELLAGPGLVAQALVNGLLLLLVPTDDDYLALPRHAYLLINVAFYAVFFYLLLVVLGMLRRSKS